MTKPAEEAKQAIPSPEDRVRAIREREQKSIKGPWTRSANSSSSVHVMARRGDIWGEDSEYVRLYKAPDNIEPLASLKGDCERRKANADFMAHARADIPYLLSLVEELKGQVAALGQERDKYQEWVNCGGCPNPHSCSDPSEPGHEIFGCAYGQGDGTFLCEVHNLRKVAAARETAEAEVALLRKRKDYHAEYVEAVEAAEKAQGELGVMREALRKIEDPGAKVDSLMEARMIARAALTPEPASQAAEEKK